MPRVTGGSGHRAVGQTDALSLVGQRDFGQAIAQECETRLCQVTSAGAFPTTVRLQGRCPSICPLAPGLPILKPPIGQGAEELFNKMVAEFA